jgi:hypothetical protein
MQNNKRPSEVFHLRDIHPRFIPPPPTQEQENAIAAKYKDKSIGYFHYIMSYAFTKEREEHQRDVEEFKRREEERSKGSEKESEESKQ